MDRALDGGHKARAHIDALGTQRQRRDQAATIAKSTGRNHRNLDLVGGCRYQNQARNIVLAGVAGALKAIDRDRIGADFLGLDRMPDGGALVDHFDAVLFEHVNVFLRVVAGGLNDFDA